MPQGGVLSLSTSISSREELSHRLFDPEFSRYIHIKVADSGLGMDEETRSRIFEPFFTTKGEGRGTGLGLAVVFGVVASHKGYITVDSQIGIGTEFHIYLPYETAEGDTETSADKPREASKGGNETILIVEDEESLREMLILTLEAKGYSVIAANDGLEAIELYNRNKHLIDVVVSDVGLPRLSGEKVLQRLRNINPAVKVILASGYLEQTQRFEAIEYGAKYILQKPYSPDEVLTTIRKIIDEQ
jgi:CheY-like chemotaxis protein